MADPKGWDGAKKGADKVGWDKVAEQVDKKHKKYQGGDEDGDNKKQKTSAARPNASRQATQQLSL